MKHEPRGRHELSRTAARALAFGLVFTNACSSDLALIASGGTGGGSSTMGEGGGGGGHGGGGGSGGAMVSCNAAPTELATLGLVLAVTPVVSGSDLFFVAEAGGNRSVQRVSLLGGEPTTVGVISPTGPTSVPQQLAVSDAVYVLTANPFQIGVLPKAGGLLATIPIPGWPATMQALPGGGIAWIRIDTNKSFIDSPYTYGQTAPGPSWTTADDQRFDDDPVFPSIGARSPTSPGFPSILAADESEARYAATLANTVLLGTYANGADTQTIEVAEPRTGAACLAGETPTAVGGPVEAFLWEPSVSSSGAWLVYWISRSNNCQVGTNPPVHRSTTELIAWDAVGAVRHVLVPPTPFVDATVSPGPLAIDGESVLYPSPAGPPRLVRQQLASGAETTVLEPATAFFVQSVGPCVVIVDRGMPAKLLSIIGNPPPP